MFSGDWLQRREMLLPTKVALVDALPLARKRSGLRTGYGHLLITYSEWNQRTNQLANSLRDGLGIYPVSDPKWGEAGRTIIVLKPGASLTLTDLRTWLCERMAHYEVPKSVLLLDVPPKTAANKVDKPKLFELCGA